MKNALLLFLLVFACAVASVAADSAPASSAVPEKYKLRVVLDLEHHSIAGDAIISFRNSGKQALASAPFILYRLMDVEAASDTSGKALAFTQKVVKFPDSPTWQVNAIEVKLPKPLAPGQSTTLHLKYSGPLLGLREVMQYVRDTISDDYSLLRAEPVPYPMLTAATYAGWSQFLHSQLDIDIETVVPAEYVAVCVVPDLGEPQATNNKMTYHCAGSGSGSHINVAVAKFRVLKDSQRALQVYALPADANAAENIMTEMRRALEFYSSYLGEVRSNGITLIEIPDGWGSYGMRGYIFQAAAAFRDKGRANELWHEVAHRWNVCLSLDGNHGCSKLVLRSRWFDEAFASYFEAVAIRHFLGEEAFRKDMEASRKYFVERSEKDPRGRSTAIADYGKEELGGFSYNKGAWSLYVLERYLGEDAFRKAIAAFLAEFSNQPADFEAFKRSVEKSSGRDLGAWFRLWILSGPESSNMLVQGKTVDEMVAEIQPPSGNRRQLHSWLKE